mgnify:CR=1 FL=1
MSSFNFYAFNDPENTISRYNNDSLGRHAWIYITAPLLAGVCAGIAARKHYDMLVEEDDKRLNSEVRVFAENWSNNFLFPLNLS